MKKERNCKAKEMGDIVQKYFQYSTSTVIILVVDISLEVRQDKSLANTFSCE